MTDTKTMPCNRCGCDVTAHKWAVRVLCDECRQRAEQEYNKRRRKVSFDNDRLFEIVAAPPGSDWRPGATFSGLDMELTLQAGYFPTGTQFRHDGKRLFVRGRRLYPVKG